MGYFIFIFLSFVTGILIWQIVGIYKGEFIISLMNKAIHFIRMNFPTSTVVNNSIQTNHQGECIGKITKPGNFSVEGSTDNYYNMEGVDKMIRSKKNSFEIKITPTSTLEVKRVVGLKSTVTIHKEYEKNNKHFNFDIFNQLDFDVLESLRVKISKNLPTDGKIMVEKLKGSFIFSFIDETSTKLHSNPLKIPVNTDVEVFILKRPARPPLFKFVLDFTDGTQVKLFSAGKS